MTTIPERGDVLMIPVYTEETDPPSAIDIQRAQHLRPKTGRYYVVKAQKQSKGNEDVLLYIQDSFYKDEASEDYIGKLQGVRKEGDEFRVSIEENFQYSQNRENRWICLHDKNYRPSQHRFMVPAAQENLAEGPKELASKFGVGDIVEQIHRLRNRLINEYLVTFQNRQEVRVEYVDNF
ncbi:hypothetical protein EDB80DRAFT_842525 [Ilyonectria destructans]|nr:hypothetical protein EDB80DRAFT_842525 [Ilyonectria destructans]